MSEQNSGRSIQVVIYHNGQKILDRVFERFPITFGRSPKSSVHLDYDFVSRAHAAITEENGQIYVSDLQSSNGVLIHGQKISRSQIHEKEAFRIGELTIEVELLDQRVMEPITLVTEEEPSPFDELKLASGEPVGRALPFSFSKPLVDLEDHKKRDLEDHKKPKDEPKRARKPKKEGTNLGRQRHSVLEQDFSPDFLELHPDLHKAGRKRIEAVLLWHNQVIDVKEFEIRQRITVGPTNRYRLHLPSLENGFALGSVGVDATRCFVPNTSEIEISKKGEVASFEELVESKTAKETKRGFQFLISKEDTVKITLGHDASLFLRYVPASHPLAGASFLEPDAQLKASLISSFVLHAVLVFICLMAAPKDENVPKIKNVPARFARLLVEKPKPKPSPPPLPQPKPEPKKEIVKEIPKPKKVVKVTKVEPKVFKVPKVIKKTNKYPIVVKNPVKKAPPPVKVEALGALAALGPISKSAPTNVVTNININKDAGGLPTKSINTGGIVGALPSSNGKLAMAGGGRVKTKGMGFGSGTGYGVQGLKGTAGGRAVAGAIVGAPKLAVSGKAIEGLTRAQVMAVVQKYLGEIQHCYEKNLLADPNLAGRMEFEWDISATGAVTQVRVKRSTVNNGDNLGECVKDIFQSMRFPKAKNGQTTTPSIGFPFGRI